MSLRRDKKVSEEFLPAQTPEHRRSRFTGKAVGLMLLVSSIGGYLVGNHQNSDRITALEHQVSANSDNLAALQDISPSTILGKGLVDPQNLQGRNKRVTLQQQRHLAGSTVTILERVKGSKYAWHQSCTGTKVAINKQNYILTAKHCFDDTRVHESQIPPFTVAADILPIQRHVYGIAEATTHSERRNSRAIAIARAVAVVLKGRTHPDMALLKVEAPKQAKHYKIYQRLPALPLREYTSALPSPGEEILLHGVPASTNPLAVSTRGVFLGRSKSAIYDPHYVDSFGFKVDDARQAPHPGVSGGSVIAANGHIFPAIVNGFVDGHLENEPILDPRDPLTDIPSKLRQSELLGLNTKPYNLSIDTVAPSEGTFQELVYGFDTKITCPC